MALIDQSLVKERKESSFALMVFFTLDGRGPDKCYVLLLYQYMGLLNSFTHTGRSSMVGIGSSVND